MRDDKIPRCTFSWSICFRKCTCQWHSARVLLFKHNRTRILIFPGSGKIYRQRLLPKERITFVWLEPHLLSRRFLYFLGDCRWAQILHLDWETLNMFALFSKRSCAVHTYYSLELYSYSVYQIHFCCSAYLPKKMTPTYWAAPISIPALPRTVTSTIVTFVLYILFSLISLVVLRH